jgi:uncharacterized membrane protein
MTLDPQTLAIILAMTAAAAFCRFAGYAFMGAIPLTPRVRAGLDAIPLAVMIAIVLPPAMRGSWPEWIGIAVVGGAVFVRFNELAAIVCGMAAVAVARSYGL